jgi:hypothetical protein
MNDKEKDILRALLGKDNNRLEMIRVKEYVEMFLPLPATTGAIS